MPMMSPPSMAVSASSATSSTSGLEEDLRESASIGDADRLTKLLNAGVDINARHALNGWTALHWAAHRGYPTICRLLLQRGADAAVKNQKGDTPGKLTERPEILQMLGEPTSRGPSHVTSPASASSSGHHHHHQQQQHQQQQPAFVPNYLRHPSFPHASRRPPPMASAAPKLASPSSSDTVVVLASNHAVAASASSSHNIDAITGAVSCLSLESGVNADCSTVDTTPSSQSNHHFPAEHQQQQQRYDHRNGARDGDEGQQQHHHHRSNDHSNPHHDVDHHYHVPQRPASSFLSSSSSAHYHNHHHQQQQQHQHHPLPYPGYNPDELVVKVRIEGHPDPDFIEVELPRGPESLDFELLLDILSEELGVPKNLISKVRKRPDTILRKDRDLMRLRDFEELEIVVSQTPCVNSPANGGRYVPKYGGVQARILY